MKSLLVVCPLLFCLAYFTPSCSKTNNITTTVRNTTTLIVRDTVIVKDTVYSSPRYPIAGLWVGAYFINGNTVDSFMYQFAIRPDGTIYTVGSGTNGTAGYASGPWTLRGTSFSATLTSMNGVTPENVQTVTATFDSVGGRLYNGVWTDIRGNSQSGTVFFGRVR